MHNLYDLNFLRSRSMPAKQLVGIAAILPIDNIVAVCEVDKEHASLPRAVMYVTDVKYCPMEEPINKTIKKNLNINNDVIPLW